MSNTISFLKEEKMEDNYVNLLNSVERHTLYAVLNNALGKKTVLNYATGLIFHLITIRKQGYI